MLTSSINASAQGQVTELEALVSDGTGSVTFTDGTTTLCQTAPISITNNKHLAYCAAAFNLLGTHSLSAIYSGDSTNFGSAGTLDQNVSATSPFNPDQFGVTGAWYNPATSGQGLVVQVFPDLNSPGSGLLFAGWFTYDISGNPRWYTLQGAVASTNNSAIVNIYETTGGNFNALPKPNAVVVGTATLAFTDCSHATLSYSFDANANHTGAQAGSMPLSRLSAAANCSPMGNGAAETDDSLLSGAWYNPAISGQGIVFDVAPADNVLFGAWYTYPPNGLSIGGATNERWFTIQGIYTDGSRNILNVPIYAATGGVFDNPAPITSSQVGTANITFNSCSLMTLNYTFTAGDLAGQAGTISMQPVGPPPAGCK
jgi:hypothetical protein